MQNLRAGLLIILIIVGGASSKSRETINFYKREASIKQKWSFAKMGILK